MIRWSCLCYTLWMLLLSVGCYSCVCLRWSGYCLKAALGHFFGHRVTLVCVVNWLLILCVERSACVLNACLALWEGGLRPPFFFNDPVALVCVVIWMLLLPVGCYSCVLHVCLVILWRWPKVTFVLCYMIWGFLSVLLIGWYSCLLSATIVFCVCVSPFISIYIKLYKRINVFINEHMFVSAHKSFCIIVCRSCTQLYKAV